MTTRNGGGTIVSSRQPDRPPQPRRASRAAASPETPETPEAPAAPDAASCPAAALLAGADAGDQVRLEQRLATVLSGLFEQRCRALVGSRLRAAPEIVRDSVLREARLGQDSAVAQVLRCLHPSEALRLLALSVEVGDTMIVTAQLGSPVPSLREAALDGWLRDLPRPELIVSQLDTICLTVLRAALLRQGLDSSHLGIVASPETDASESSAEPVFLNHLRHGATAAAIACLARAAQVEAAQVRRAIGTRDPRLLVSLAWKAGYSMQAATLLQTGLAGIPPERALGATSSGACPLGRGEMAWQLREADPRAR